ncbi:MAG TPA: hypothetical protein VM223_20995 [Planctomycetota bacterium]|nr:hypothetical protein [Planctomycetota bacterium]
MNKVSVLNGILIGLVVVLLGVLLLQGPGKIAGAVDNEGSATTPRGTGIGAGGVIAVTGQYAQDNSVLYLIDTNREVVLCYACYPKGRANVFRDPIMDFLAGRSYVWDGSYVQKAGFYGATERHKPSEVRERMKALKED